MKKKRILSVLMIFVMVIAMAATGCGKKEEPKVEEEVSTDDKKAEEDVSEDPEADAAEPTDEGAATDSGEMKTGDDVLSEEDIQDLKETIRDTVISEYIEANNISDEDSAWPDKDSPEWIYMGNLVVEYNLAVTIGYEMDISKIDSSSCSNPDIIEAVFNGATYWLNKQGKYNADYAGNVFEALYPYSQVIPTIDLTSK